MGKVRAEETLMKWLIYVGVFALGFLAGFLFSDWLGPIAQQDDGNADI